MVFDVLSFVEVVIRFVFLFCFVFFVFGKGQNKNGKELHVLRYSILGCLAPHKKKAATIPKGKVEALSSTTRSTVRNRR